MTAPATRRLALVFASAFLLAAALGATPAQAAEPFGIESFQSTLTDQAEAPVTQAGAHPYAMSTTIGFDSHPPSPEQEESGLFHNIPNGDPKSLEVNLPRGLIVDPAATPTLCTEAELEIPGSSECPASSAVGVSVIHIGLLGGIGPAPVYNMVPPPGVPAELGFDAVGLGIIVHIDGALRSGDDYGLSARVSGITQKAALDGATLTLWGNPSDESHDKERGFCATEAGKTFVEEGGICPTPPTDTPLLAMPTSCPGTPLTATMRADSWQHPEEWAEAEATSPAIEACEAPEFTPTIEAKPEATTSETPTGLHVDLHIPQNEEFENEAHEPQLAEADLKDARVTLPKGLVVNPSSADGLAACTSAQIELHGPEPAQCPDASKLGTVEVDSPLLAEYDEAGTEALRDGEGNPIPHPLKGSVYLAAQDDNPFHSLLAIYIAIDDPQTGVVVKLAGHVEPDPQTGQLTTSFSENPQLPFEDFKLDFFGGPRAALVTPSTCGHFETTTDLTPWTSPEGEDAHPSSPFDLTEGPNGPQCANAPQDLPLHPGFIAHTTDTTAGAFSPLALQLTRSDGEQPFKAINVTLPPGLSGRLAGVGECSDAQLAAAEHKTGAAEKASPSCPLSSELGTVNVGAGAGPNPYYVQGKAYLAGPYKSAPLSMAILTPAVAGPFDLGTVVVRSALYVNPETAQITVKSDPLPQILAGIPLDVRSIAVNVSRNQFTLNPTDCNPLALSGEVLASSSTANVSSPFQVGGCAALPFRPKLALALKGKTTRTGHPALTATLTAKPGEANIARAQVTLPHSEFLDQAHIGTVCTRVQFNQGNGNGAGCPAASVYGHARAISPLLEAPLEGPVYLRSSDHKLPDLVAALNGQIDVALDGKVDTGKGGGIRNTFEVVPDAPVSKFVLSMQGGKKGLLVNSENLCSPKAKTHASVNLTAQNGKVHDTTPALASSCAKAHGNHHKRGAR